MGEMYFEPGDLFTYCFSTEKQRQFGDLMYQPKTCQIKFKWRAMGIWNKVPGFFRISSYEQVTRQTPGFLMSSG